MKISPLCAGAVIGAALITALWTATVQRVGLETRNAIAAAETANSSLAIAYEEKVASSLSHIDQVLRFVGAEYYFKGARVSGSAQWMPLNRDLILALGVIDGDGTLVFSEATNPRGQAPGDLVMDHLWEKDRGVHLSAPRIDPASGRWEITASRRIEDEDGGLVGVAVAEIDPGYFAQFFRRAGVGPGGVIALVGLDGVARVRLWRGQASYGDDMRDSVLLKSAAGNNAGSYLSPGNNDGTRRLISFRRMGEHPFLVMLGTDSRDAVRPVEERARVYYLVAALMSLVIVAAAAGITSSISRQRKQLQTLARAEAELRRGEAYTRAIADSMAAGVLTLECDGTILSANPAAAAMQGLAPPDLVGRNVLDMAHPSDKGLVSATIGELGKRTREYRERPREFLAMGRDGRSFEVECLISGFPHASGFTHVGVIQDISERKRVLRELRDSESRFRATFNQALVGICHLSLDGRFHRVNQRFCQMLGYSQSEMAGRPCTEVSHPDHTASMIAMMQSLIEGEGASSYQATRRYLRKDGGVIWGLASVTLIRDADGAPEYFLAMIQDITELKRVEQTKNEFVSTVSHELRTPLTSIRGSLGLLTGGVVGPLPVEARKLVDIALGNSERLIRLVNDILDIEKMDSGKMRFELARVDIAALLPGVIAANEGYAREHGVALRLAAAGPLHAAVDRDRLEQALTNLISNAVKYSRRGDPVEVRLVRRGRRARIEVRDRGPGIPSEFRARIFRKFSQADGSDARRMSGTGLGLCIAKGIAERMGGDVGYDTKPGEGTTFFIDLPAESETTLVAGVAQEA